MRRPHKMRPNESTEIPRHAVVVDTETVPEVIGSRAVHHLRLGWAAYIRRDGGGNGKPYIEYHEYRSADEYWSWLYRHCRPRMRIYMLGHNVDYDMAVLGGYSRLPADGWVVGKSWERQMAIYREYHCDRCTLVVMSTTNLWPMPLADIGKCIGLPKLEVDYSTATDEELSTYCRRDVEILVRMWLWWLDQIERYDLGCYRPTIAAQALTAYRHRWMDYDIYIHTDERAIQLERAAYHGGRVECHRIGIIEDGPVYILDVNSMYPYVMREHDYPVRLMGVYDGGSPQVLRSIMEHYQVIAEVQLQTDEPAYGVYRDDTLLFPVGLFWGCLCTPELEYALGRGHIVQVRRYAVYQHAPIYRRWVDEVYGYRCEAKAKGDKQEELLWKLLLNSLYGKWGQKLEVWERVGECDPGIGQVVVAVDPRTGKRTTYRMREGIIEACIGYVEGYDSMVAIPAHVSAYARMYLWRLMLGAGLDHVYYTDTDSLHVDEIGYSRLRGWVDPTRLGRLKLEAVVGAAEYRGPKEYRVGNIVKRKGIRRDAVEVADGVYEQDRWLGYRSRLRLGALDTPMVERTRKRLRRGYKKGVVQPDGRITPIVLYEPDPPDD